jgi:hypothetical protein
VKIWKRYLVLGRYPWKCICRLFRHKSRYVLQANWPGTYECIRCGEKWEVDY